METNNGHFTSFLLRFSTLFLFFLFFTYFGHAQGWLQMDQTITGSESGDYQGYWIVMSSDGYTIASGAMGCDAGGEDAGAARVFEWNGSAWGQKGSDILGLAVDDELGYSVGLSNDGSILAVGATEDTDEQTKNGYAKVFEWDGGDWVQMGPTMQGDNPYDRFGTSVSLSADGQVLAVGSRNGPNGEESGNVKVFEWDGAEWAQLGSAINGTYEYEACGWALDLNDGGDILAVGFPGDGVNTNGIARIYEYDAGDWQQIGPDLTGDAPAARFGWVISLNAAGDVVAVGSRDFDGGATDQGQVKVFSRNGNDWELMGNPVTGQVEREFFGWSVDMSSDGMTFIAGLTPLVVRGWDEGHARIYEFNGSDWIMKGEQIDGENEGDRAGFTVAMNDDGNRVTLGAPFASASGWGEGKLMVYEFGYVNVQDNASGEAFSVYPNPASGVSSFRFQVSGFKHVTLKIYDLHGREMATVADSEFPAGEHVVSFDASHLPPGVYIYRKLSETKSASGGSAVSSQQSAVGKLIKY